MRPLNCFVGRPPRNDGARNETKPLDSSPRRTNPKTRARGAPHKGQGRSPARSCWGKSVKAVIGPLPLGRSKTKTRS